MDDTPSPASAEDQHCVLSQPIAVVETFSDRIGIATLEELHREQIANDATNVFDYNGTAAEEP